MRISTRRAFVGGIVLIACIQYPIAEAIAAAAWRNPAYSYVTNYISDLGVIGCTPELCSPLASIMNAGFVVSGILAITAALLLGPLLPAAGWRLVVQGLMILHGLGVIVVGLVHSAPHTAAGTPWQHLAGAYAAILGGNFALCALALAARSARTPSWYPIVIGALGLLGLAGGVALVATSILPTGLLERIAADTITPAEVVTGIALLARLRRSDAGRDEFVLTPVLP